MNRYILGSDAELDLNAIWEYIAEDSLDAADRWVEGLFAAFEALAQTPEWDIGVKISHPRPFYSGR